MEFAASQIIASQANANGRTTSGTLTLGPINLGDNGSELRLTKAGTVRLTAKAAAMLAVQPDETIRTRKLNEKPYWHIERARIGDTRTVQVEALINGQPAAKRLLKADGHLEDIAFDLDIAKSCWVALRIYPSSHTNPIWITVNDKPVREKASLEWCLKGVDQCWSQKRALIAEKEQADAVAAYEHARQVYRTRLAEADE
jgi:hypothetical protein